MLSLSFKHVDVSYLKFSLCINVELCVSVCVCPSVVYVELFGSFPNVLCYFWIQ